MYQAPDSSPLKLRKSSAPRIYKLFKIKCESDSWKSFYDLT